MNIYSRRFPNDALFIDAKMSVISKFNHRKLALSVSWSNARKNRYCLISVVLTLEQNMLITTTSWQLLVFILSSSFLLISADAFHIFSLREKHSFITCWFGFCFTFWCPKGRIHAGRSFLLPFLLFHITQDWFLPNFLARIRSWKSWLAFVCGYKRVVGSLQAGRSTRCLATIETPDLSLLCFLNFFLLSLHMLIQREISLGQFLRRYKPPVLCNLLLLNCPRLAFGLYEPEWT